LIDLINLTKILGNSEKIQDVLSRINKNSQNGESFEKILQRVIEELSKSEVESNPINESSIQKSTNELPRQDVKRSEETLKNGDGLSERKVKEITAGDGIERGLDNVKGEFPIGFTIWNLNKKVKIKQITCDVYDRNGEYIGEKNFYGNLPDSINKWIKLFDDKNHNGIGYMGNPSPDFQHNSQLYISINKGIEHFNFWNFTQENIFQGCIYFAVRHCIEATWINDRDQFLYPNDGWKLDTEFKNDCLAFTIFHGQNKISCKDGTNYWIPFTEKEVDAREKFDSNFMSNFIKGKQNPPKKSTFMINLVFEPEISYETGPLKFSPEAQAVFDAGRELWKYYHQQPNVNVNASLYDIKEYFQGRNEKGKMNSKSNDEKYMKLLNNLKDKLQILAEKIEPKVYEYGFLKK